MATATADRTQAEAQATAQAQDGASPNGAAKAPKVYGPQDTVTVNVRVPFEMKQKLIAAAEAEFGEGKGADNIGLWARRQLAETVEYTLPEPKPRERKASMTPEERKAARADQYATQKLLLEALRKGMLGVSLDDLKTKLAAVEAAA